VKVLKRDEIFASYDSEIIPAPIEDVGSIPGEVSVSTEENDKVESTPKVTQTSEYTYYHGRLVRFSQQKTSRFTINADSFWDYPIVEDRKGILVYFIVSVNDEDMKVTAKLKDFQNNFFELNNRTMKELSYLGRGLTYGEAHAISSSGTSLDKSGFPHTTLPYLSRFKDTPTGGETEYEHYVGTPEDKWITLAYYPVDPLEFNRFELDIKNTRADGAARYVHEVEVFIIYPLDNYPETSTKVLEAPNEGPLAAIIGSDPQVQKIVSSATNPIIIGTSGNTANKAIIEDGEADMVMG